MNPFDFQNSFRKMVSVAHRFARAEAPFMEFYYACLETQSNLRGVKLDDKVSTLVREWPSLAERCRNEFGESTAPLSEQELREKISRELAENDAPSP